jgi:dienelactone hydrolase
MSMTIPNNSSAKRTTVQIPTASGDAIEAWVYLPEGSGPHPAVVMAHGIGGIKAGGLAPFAERFREEGFAAIAFDYRNFGGSGGTESTSRGRPPARGLQYRHRLGS